VKNRFVAGILVVLFLEVCFHAFNELERLDDRFVNSNATTSVSSPVESSPVAVAELPIGDDYFDDWVPSSARTPIKRLPEAVRPQFASLRPEPVQHPLFEPIRITYPSRTAVALTLTPPPTLAQEQTIVAVNETQKTELPKKNEGSVVARVVKKPYELLKFVGSKLR